MGEKKLEKFCHEHDIDCNDCPLRDECSEYYGKASRFLPKQLHKMLKSLREALSLVGYDVVDIRMRDRTDGKEYLWTEWK